MDSDAIKTILWAVGGLFVLFILVIVGISIFDVQDEPVEEESFRPQTELETEEKPKIVYVPKPVYIPEPFPVPVEKHTREVIHVPQEKIIEKIVPVPQPFPVKEQVIREVLIPYPVPEPIVIQDFYIFDSYTSDYLYYPADSYVGF